MQCPRKFWPLRNALIGFRSFVRKDLALIGLLLLTHCLGAQSNAFDKLLLHAQGLIEQGNLDAARTELVAALKANAQEPRLYNLLGVVEARQGRLGAAESNFRKAIAVDPRFTGAYINLGHLYVENAVSDPAAARKALEAYSRLLQVEPDSIEANYQSAALLEHRGSFVVSLEHLSRLPVDAQRRPQVLAVRCADYAGEGDLSRAQSVADDLLVSPDLSESDIALILGDIDKRKEYALEVRLLERLAGRGLASANFLHQLAVAYQAQGHADQARAALEKVAQAQPTQVQPLMELAHFDFEQHNYKGALGYLAHARDLEPQNAAVHFFFGMVCVEENLVQEAYNSLRKAVELENNNAYYNYALGAVAVEQTDASQAIPYFKRYRELKPRDPRGRLALGAAYFYSHDDQAAREELEAVARLRETATGAHYFLGRIANQEGDLPKAIEELQQALKTNPRYADAQAELGFLHLKQKNYSEAERFLLNALKIDPGNYTANLNLMILYQRTKDPRAEAQAGRFQQVQDKRAERTREFLRTVVIEP
jgi:tetratricopeptide (TPR) repeat protein